MQVVRTELRGAQMNERLEDEVIELTNKISALGYGYSNATVLYAAVNLISQHVAVTARTEVELEHFTGEIYTALSSSIAQCWNELHPVLDRQNPPFR